MIPNVVRGSGFRGCLDYVFSQLKTPEVVASNMSSDVPRVLAQEFGFVRRLNEKATTAVWHVSLSAAPDERFDEEQWSSIVEKFINLVGSKAIGKEIGISSERNQFIAVRHQDTDHDHVHIVLNRVNYDAEICYCKWERNRVQEACREIEKSFGLVQVEGKTKGEKKPGSLTRQQIAILEKQAALTGEVDPRLQAYYDQREKRAEGKRAKGKPQVEVVEAATNLADPQEELLPPSSADSTNSTDPDPTDEPPSDTAADEQPLEITPPIVLPSVVDEPLELEALEAPSADLEAVDEPPKIEPQPEIKLTPAQQKAQDTRDKWETLIRAEIKQPLTNRQVDGWISTRMHELLPPKEVGNELMLAIARSPVAQALKQMQGEAAVRKYIGEAFDYGAAQAKARKVAQQAKPRDQGDR